VPLSAMSSKSGFIAKLSAIMGISPVEFAPHYDATAMQQIDDIPEKRSEAKQKTARRRSLYSRFGFDQTIRMVGLLFRRYAMKPTPKNPKIIIAQVEGSGTAVTVTSNDPELSW
jgi:hypothetical protein